MRGSLSLPAIDKKQRSSMRGSSSLPAIDKKQREMEQASADSRLSEPARGRGRRVRCRGVSKSFVEQVEHRARTEGHADGPAAYADNVLPRLGANLSNGRFGAGAKPASEWELLRRRAADLPAPCAYGNTAEITRTGTRRLRRGARQPERAVWALRRRSGLARAERDCERDRSSGEGLDGVDPMGVRPMGELDAAIAEARDLPGPGQYGDVARVDPRGKSETVSSFGYHAYHEKQRQGPRRRRRRASSNASSTSSDGSGDFTVTFAAGHRNELEPTPESVGE